MVVLFSSIAEKVIQNALLGYVQGACNKSSGTTQYPPITPAQKLFLAWHGEGPPVPLGNGRRWGMTNGRKGYMSPEGVRT